MPERFNFKVGIPNSGLDAFGRERKPWVKPLRASDIIDTIKANPHWEDWLKNKLIEKVSSYPVSALKHFYKNINLYAEELQVKRMENEKERNEEN